MWRQPEAAMAWEPSFPFRAAWNIDLVTSAHTSWTAPSSMATARRLGNIVVSLVATCYIKLPITGEEWKKEFQRVHEWTVP